MTAYKPASFFVVDVPGPGGWWIGLAQALAGDASRYKHAGAILDEQGTILEAEPGGARIANIAEYAGAGLLISDLPVQLWMQKVAPTGDGPHEQDWMAATERTLRGVIVDHARDLEDTPYSWLDYASIGLLHIVDALPRWLQKVLRPLLNRLRDYVANSGHAQCAQLVDLVYDLSGVHLFKGKEPGDVCPADLAAWIEDGGHVW